MLQLGVDIAFGANAGAWHRAGQYLVWTGAVPTSGSIPQILEQRDEGAVPVDPQPHMLHVVGAGTPHRLSHLFGFWRVSDGDTCILLAQEPELTRYGIVAVTSAPSYAKERLRFHCPRCNVLLKALAFDAGRLGFERFWDEALVEVRAFAADPAAGVCPQCSAVHPVPYGLCAERDNDAEAASRRAW